MRKYIQNLQVVNKQILSEEYYLLELKSLQSLPEILPGQFAEIAITGSATFLRRPLSIHDVDYDRNTISFLVQIVGKGTKYLANIEPGKFLNVIFPLGKGFGLINNLEKALLVGGGCGIAPLLYLARHLYNKGVSISTLIGVRSSMQFIEVDKYKLYGKVLITTEDGSEGTTGFVVNHPVFEQLSQFKKIYTCGPDVMMKAIAKKAIASGVDCEVSLENSMACGIGACLCCVTETIEGNKCVCTEGPVFNIKYLKWQI
ncbi:MAG: dihydroorotate dehydrogenase electron transfer subunit [Bacteroidetes bacterium CG23_combo_of_CG06-09_8_20_14_all_32_9]|nr:MAG: dihydroorotate dehydrogenase electron transfer subunit [Bacteroidetes bacterium CG23_combo_of_CG06-09_8_20_14_all_32_9]